MAPIRTAIIGLTAKAGSNPWAKVAHLPYLLSARGRQRYEIVALCNSTEDSARAAIAHFALPSSVRAYGSPADLARDDAVDLVVCATRVDVHHRTVRPILEAGKPVLCEWPLAEDTEHARDLATVAEEKGVRTAVGVQGRFSPVSIKIREVIAGGRIGKVLSVEALASGGLNGRDTAPESLAYWWDRSIGGNLQTIAFGHTLDTIQSLVGDISDLRGHTHLQRPTVTVRSQGDIVKTMTSGVPDLIIATGRLEESSTTQADASVLMRLRLGPGWPREPPLVVRINGEKGELRLRVEGGMFVSVSLDKPIVIEVHDFATDQIEVVPWAWEEWQAELPNPAKNTGALYEAYARGDEGMTFSEAVRAHKKLDKLLEGFLAKYS